MRLYKITDVNMKTRNNTQWGENKTNLINNYDEKELCTDSWIHAYRDPLLGSILNPWHANYDPFIMWEAKGIVGIDDGLKVGCKMLTTIKIIPKIEITPENNTCFAILCCLEVFNEPKFTRWAKDWLHNKDRKIKTSDDLYKILFTIDRSINNFSHLFEKVRNSIRLILSERSQINDLSCVINISEYINNLPKERDQNFMDLAKKYNVKVPDKINFIELANKAMKY